MKNSMIDCLPPGRAVRLSSRRIGGAAVTLGVLMCSSAHAAAVVVYSNLTTFGGSFYANGATTALGSPSADYTPFVADDISPITGYTGAPVTSITFTVVNAGAAAASANVELAIYGSNGTSGGPGTLIQEVNTSIASQAAGTIDGYTLTSPTGFFNLPTNFFWAGVSFSDGGTATATPAELAEFGQGLFNPPTIGTSQDAFFASTVTTNDTASNPTGQISYFGGSPVANFGLSFSVTPVPEPISGGIVVFAGMGLLARRRRVRVSDAG
jgi:hypothetical protein